MKVLLRMVLAVVVGVAVALVLLMGVEGFSAVVYPFPEGFGWTEEEMCRHVAKYPAWVLGVVIPMWGLAALLSVWVAGRIGSVGSAGLVGVLFLAAVIVNVVMLPYPWWFKVGSPLGVLVGIGVGARLGRHRELPSMSKVISVE